MAEATGAFETEFAAKKRWKVDAGLWAAMLAVFHEGERIVDLGAGAGRYVDLLRQHGFVAEGVDAIPGIGELTKGLVQEVDLTTPDLWGDIYAGRGAHEHWRPEAAIFVEVGEHVPAGLSGQLLDNVADAASQRLLVSWAVPGQRGRDHIHCQPPEWVACEMGKRGWSLDSDLTAKARELAGKGWDRKLMVFGREGGA